MHHRSLAEQKTSTTYIFKLLASIDNNDLPLCLPFQSLEGPVSTSSHTCKRASKQQQSLTFVRYAQLSRFPLDDDERHDLIDSSLYSFRGRNWRYG
jgi:hypothetical protein